LTFSHNFFLPQLGVEKRGVTGGFQA
jgi:hypothetical protein